ncbi:acetate--CoA ligase family protein [Saccharopolyspora erythraea]|uniref:acetate--CoA ligase family protein n=1 Tax=Saccharopolyspora erythraea TaxID=1836 RepID=UPI001BA52FFA|nr:acetate--CoA ligase family protein [Saccharopolyspora erythraea]QUH04113.1 acetate--CoA ligase family protein [Saccharopolyspora erythraea]
MAPNPTPSQADRAPGVAALSGPLLHPASVAIVGASDDPKKTTGRPQRFLAAAGYEGTAWFVNPRRETVQGEKAYPRLSALPAVPDHVYVMTGADAAVDTVAEAARLGVPVVTVLSSGFAEEGAEGKAREDRLRAAAAQGPTRVVGPSSLGVVNPRNGVMLTGNAAFGEADTPTGGIFVASQSGSVIGAMVSRARGRGIGFAGLVSTGGEADLSLGEICSATLDDPEITSYALFLESLRHAGDLADFAAAAHRAGKPVAVYKLGRSDEAAALTVSHTGALAGEDSEAEAFFRACGFVRVATFEGLCEAPALLERIPSDGPARPRVGVVTTTGGGAAIMVDQLALRGLSVRGPSHELVERMAAAGAPVPHSLIADLGLAGAKHDVVSAALRELQDSGEFDLVLFVIGSSARLNPELAVQALAERGGHAVPVVGFALPEAPDAANLLASSGVPAFRTPESCADAIAAAFSRRSATIDPKRIAGLPEGTPRLLDEQASAELLAGGGVPPLPSVALKTASIDDEITLPFGYPVVVKALSDQLAHKTDVGGVVLGVADADALRAAVRKIAVDVAERAGITVDRVLVQPMAEKGVAEVLVGYRRSPDVGPVVVLSTGGVQAELYDDSAVRLAPVDRATAQQMIDEVAGLAVLKGHRGAPAGDIPALADAVVALSRLAVEHPSIVEAEANPVLVRTEGVVALDALVRRIDDEKSGRA